MGARWGKRTELKRVFPPEWLPWPKRLQWLMLVGCLGHWSSSAQGAAPSAREDKQAAKAVAQGTAKVLMVRCKVGRFVEREVGPLERAALSDRLRSGLPRFAAERCINALSVHPAPQDTQAIQIYLHHRNSRVRALALRALAHHPPKATKSAALQGLKDHHPVVRAAALFVLKSHPTPEALPLLRLGMLQGDAVSARGFGSLCPRSSCWNTETPWLRVPNKVIFQAFEAWMFRSQSPPETKELLRRLYWISHSNRTRREPFLRHLKRRARRTPAMVKRKGLLRWFDDHLWGGGARKGTGPK